MVLIGLPETRHRWRPMLTKIASMLILLLVAGCSTYSDPNIGKTKVTGGVLHNDTTYFCQNASYTTQEGVFQGTSVLSYLLGYWRAQDIVLIRFQALSQNEFKTEFLDRHLNVSESRHYIKGTDYQLDTNGAIEIKAPSRCTSRDTPGVGCMWSKVRIFTDHVGNLAVIEAKGGAGLVGLLIPVSVSSKYMSLFPPVTPANGSLQDSMAQCPENREAKKIAEFQKNKVVPTPQQPKPALEE